jgi:hypothetical protein
MIARGAVLVVVTGLAALIAALTLALLARVGDDAREALGLEAQAQARAMVVAALTYVQEASRLGWDDPLTPEHEEAFGWTDVRDGTPGPKDRLHRMLAPADPVTGLGPRFPAVGGIPARCPTRLVARPPSAIEPVLVPNPLPAAPSGNWRADISYAQPDPRPWVDPAWPASLAFERWRAGDHRPVPGTDRAWFRCYRPTPAECDRHLGFNGAMSPIHWSPGVFILACGAGATQGWRDWSEVVADGAGAVFGGDQRLFEQLRADETILWYACEWSAMQGSFGHKYLHQDEDIPGGFPDGTGATCRIRFAQSGTNRPWKDDTSHRTNSRDFGGSFLWIERLAVEPERW